MSDLAASSRMFLTAKRTARRYVLFGYGIVVGGVAVVAGVSAGLAKLGFSGATLGTVMTVFICLCLIFGGLTAAAGHRMLSGRSGLHVGDDELTVLSGWRSIPIAWRDLEYFAVRRWGRRTRELQVRFRPEVLPPRGLSTGRPAAPGRPATSLTPLFQLSMLGDREKECVAELERHLARQS